jgi:NADH-quinone oxidoreductase subunit C/D
VPVGHAGDARDRMVVRFEEMVESARILRQCCDRLPAGPIQHDDWKVVLPPKERVYGSIEGLMGHFNLIMHGTKVPAGERYDATEAPNGELGFYAVSDGSGKPYRLRVRPPCFPIYSAFARLVEGHLVADAIAVLGGLNVIAGELDR